MRGRRRKVMVGTELAGYVQREPLHYGSRIGGDSCHII